MSVYIDTHCHLDLFKNILKTKEAEDRQGIKTITVTNAPSFYRPNDKLFCGCSNIKVALGLHPQLAHQYKGEVILFEQLISHIKFVGEIGLDGSVEFKDTFLLQKSLFQRILDIVKSQTGKILSIHSRNAATDTIEILSRYIRKNKTKVILHWYSGSITDLKAAILQDFYFSINHKMVATEKGNQIVSLIPEHLLLTETDAPFTFSRSIDSRLKSLSSTINGIAIQKSKSPDDVRNLIYNNYKNLLT